MGVTDRLRRDIAEALRSVERDLAQEVLDASVADAPPSPPPGEDPNEAISLREAGYVQPLPGGGVEIGFRTAYAAKQHENFRLKHPRGGQAKFLERNVMAAARELEGRVAVEVNRAMRGHGRTGTRVDTTRG